VLLASVNVVEEETLNVVSLVEVIESVAFEGEGAKGLNFEKSQFVVNERIRKGIVF